MARPPKILPSHGIHLRLPEDIHARLQLHLFRESDRCIPRGSVQTFFVERLNEYFSGRARPGFSPDLRQETYLALENIFAVASKKGANPQEALRALARWSRIYADKLLEDSP
jgi:hypothetical protein